MPKKQREPDIIFMTDVDNCLLDNETGELNEVILRFLAENKNMISSLALMTGRDITGISRTLQNHKDIPSINLEKNGLTSVKERIEKFYSKEIVVCTTKDLVGEDNKPGDYYSSYGPLEAAILDADDRDKISEKLTLYERGDLSWITDEGLRNHANKTAKWDRDFDKMTSEDGFDMNSFDKGPQVKFYLKSLEASGADSVKIYIDDVPSNVKNVANQNPEVIAVLVNVEMGKGYNEQALKLAISAANGNEKSKEKLKNGVNEYKKFNDRFTRLKDLGVINKKATVRDLVKMAVEDGDWFKAVEKCSNPLDEMITEYNVLEFNKDPQRKNFLIESYNEFIESLKVASDDKELAHAIALSLGGDGSSARPPLDDHLEAGADLRDPPPLEVKSTTTGATIIVGLEDLQNQYNLVLTSYEKDEELSKQYKTYLTELIDKFDLALELNIIPKNTSIKKFVDENLTLPDKNWIEALSKSNEYLSNKIEEALFHDNNDNSVAASGAAGSGVAASDVPTFPVYFSQISPRTSSSASSTARSSLDIILAPASDPDGNTTSTTNPPAPSPHNFLLSLDSKKIIFDINKLQEQPFYSDNKIKCFEAFRWPKKLSTIDNESNAIEIKFDTKEEKKLTTALNGQYIIVAHIFSNQDI